MKTFETVLTAIALAMGVAVIVLGILKAGSIETCTMLLGIGLFAISLAQFQKKK